MASTAAFQPGPFMAVYCATKAYVLSFSLAVREDCRDWSYFHSIVPRANDNGVC